MTDYDVTAADGELIGESVPRWVADLAAALQGEPLTVTPHSPDVPLARFPLDGRPADWSGA
jgi:hypothetical protein